MKKLVLTFAYLLTIIPILAAPAKAQHLDFAFNLGSAEIPEDPFWVEEQGIIAEIRLVPQRLYAAEEDVLALDGRLLLPAGAHLMPLASEISVLCNWEKTDDREYQSGKKRVCLVDEDNDGSFDTYFERGIRLTAQLRSRRDALEVPRIAEISTDEAEDTPYLSLHYQRYVDDGNWFQAALDASSRNATPDGSFIRFHVKWGEERERNRAWIAPGCGLRLEQPFCTSGALPNEFSLWGMKLHILERNDEDLLIQILSDFDPIAFRIGG